MKGRYVFIIINSFFVLTNSYSQDLKSELDIIAKKNDLMGASLVVFCGEEIVQNLSMGTSDYTRDIKMTIDSKYRIASISKTITAIAIMQLMEQGQLNLDQDISIILGYKVQNPNAPGNPITARMLMSHTSTLFDGPTYNKFLDATYNDKPIPSLSEILTPSGRFYTNEQFSNALPGTYFHYSNLNYVILGTLIERVTGLRFDVYCKKYISDPLGIDASFNTDDLTNIDELAVIYRKLEGNWTPQTDNFQGIKANPKKIEGYIPGTNGGHFGPQGGFRCSAQDLAKIFMTLMNEGNYGNVRLLSSESCNEMFAQEWKYDSKNGDNYNGLFLSWGLGIHRISSSPIESSIFPNSELMLGHSGEAYGLVSNAYFDTAHKFGFIFLNNGVGIGYHKNEESKFYTLEQEIFKALQNVRTLKSCLLSSNGK
ncbi:MAG: serine hydrolase domain-containing protein [Bacteroidota bacterium]